MQSWKPFLACAVVCGFLIPRVTVSQTVYSLTRGNAVVAHETLVDTANTPTVDAVVGAGSLTLHGAIVRGNRRPKSYDASIAYSSAAERNQHLHIDFEPGVAKALFSGQGLAKPVNISYDEKRPLLIFENLLFTLVGSTLPNVPVGKSDTVQVLIPQLRAVQLWQLARPNDSTSVLTTSEGLEMTWVFRGGHIAEFRVDAQGVVERPEDATKPSGTL